MKEKTVEEVIRDFQKARKELLETIEKITKQYDYPAIDQ